MPQNTLFRKLLCLVPAVFTICGMLFNQTEHVAKKGLRLHIPGVERQTCRRLNPLDKFGTVTGGTSTNCRHPTSVGFKKCGRKAFVMAGNSKTLNLIVYAWQVIAFYP